MFLVQLAAPYVDSNSLEIVYGSMFMVACCSAAILARWTTQRLLIFMFVVATLLCVCKASRAVLSVSITPYTASPVSQSMEG